jgi:hypothetical protein
VKNTIIYLNEALRVVQISARFKGSSTLAEAEKERRDNMNG